MSFFGSRKQAEPAPPPTPQKPQPPPPSQHPVPQQPVGFETVLGTNCTLEGKLHSNANVRLDGTFTGTLEISGPDASGRGSWCDDSGSGNRS